MIDCGSVISLSFFDCFALRNISAVLEALATKPLEAINFNTLIASITSTGVLLLVSK